MGIADAVKFEVDTEAATNDKTSANLESNKAKSKRKLFVGSQALGYRRDSMEAIPALKDGIVVDWDVVDNLWDHAFQERLLIDPKEHPMLIVDPSSNSQQQRATSFVVDCGGGSTTVTAVHNGYVLHKVVVPSPIGGELLTNCLM